MYIYIINKNRRGGYDYVGNFSNMEAAWKYKQEHAMTGFVGGGTLPVIFDANDTFIRANWDRHQQATEH